ncbi:MAG TPA: hypothetical protein VG815_00850 [Chloroflexota bacterium]|nr:hypothetical protein [Chloroflexota bacterium]
MSIISVVSIEWTQNLKDEIHGLGGSFVTADPPDNTSGRRPSWLRFRIAYLLILALMAVFAFKFGQQVWDNHQRDLALAAVNAQIADQNQSIASLTKQIHQLHTLPYIRHQAIEWGYVTPGERPVLVTRVNHAGGRHERRTHVATPPSVPVWRRWWNAFFGGSGG